MSQKQDEIARLEQLADGYSHEAAHWCKDIVCVATLQLLHNFDLRGRVLLMGIGDGLILEGLAAIPEIQLTTVEGSQQLIDRFAHVKNVEFQHSLFEDYRTETKFAAVIGTHILEHVLDPVAIAQNVKNWIQPGGQIFFTVPNADSLHRRIGVEMGLLSNREELNESDHRLGHRRVYRVETLKSDLEKAGLIVQEVRGYILKVVPNSMMAAMTPEFLRASYRVSLMLAPEYCSSLCAICRPA